MAPTPTGRGYWLVASDGGVFTFGDAHFYGSTGGLNLVRPIVGMAPTPTGRGYWLVASDGGIFTFGDAHFYGSIGGKPLAQPIVGMARSYRGHGYWMVASDGGIFTFGDARFYGSAATRHLSHPVVGMARTPDGRGYWIATRNGGVYAYGGAHTYGSATNAMAGQAAVAIVASPAKTGYWLATQWGGVNAATSSGVKMDPNLTPRAPAPSHETLIANELVKRINVERAARHLHPLSVDPLLTLSAASWAHFLASSNRFEHQDLYALLQRGGWQEDGENIAITAGPGAVDAGTAHHVLMQSQVHRTALLDPNQRLVGVGAACFNGSLLVVEDFATPFGVPIKSFPVPPLDPIASSDQGGASC